MIPPSGPGKWTGAVLAAPAGIFLGDLLSQACLDELHSGHAGGYGLKISGTATVSWLLGKRRDVNSRDLIVLF